MKCCADMFYYEAQEYTIMMFKVFLHKHVAIFNHNKDRVLGLSCEVAYGDPRNDCFSLAFSSNTVFIVRQ